MTEIREDEKHFVKLMSYVQSASYALTLVVPIIAVIVTFLIHIGFGFELSPAEVYFKMNLHFIEAFHQFSPRGNRLFLPWHFQGFAIVTVMMSRIRPSLNTARESLKTWDKAKVIWPRTKVMRIALIVLLLSLYGNVSIILEYFIDVRGWILFRKAERSGCCLGCFQRSVCMERYKRQE